jgi:hypothetical protein
MSRNKPQTRQIRYLMRRPALFSWQTGSIKLRRDQEQAIQAVIDSVIYNRGMEFTWIFPRQSGKDESLAVLVQYLLTCSMIEGAEMVFFNPTFKPQTETSMRRLEARLQSNVLTKGKWKQKSGYIYQMKNAFCTYLSGDPTANTVGATANLLVVVKRGAGHQHVQKRQGYRADSGERQRDQAVQRDTLDDRHAAGTGVPALAGR